jgi:hypothetical protein
MDIEDDDGRYRKNRGTPQVIPVIMEDDDISVDNSKQMAEETSIANSRTKTYSQTRKEWEELDEIVQEFSRGERTQKYVLGKQYERNFQPREVKMSSRTNEVLMAAMRETINRTNQKGLLTREDIPRLHEEWMKSNKDIMNRALERLPPLRELNHRIPIMDENKRYKYHSPRCPDSLKPKLIEKIARYTRAGWWEPIQVDQAAPMLCVHKKTMALRTIVDGRQCNENMLKDVTPLPDQDLIRLDVARAKIRSKINLSDTYEQVHIVPSDVPKMAFATIYGTFASNVMQQGDCNAPSMFQRSMNTIFHDYIGIFMHTYLDDLFVYSDMIEGHQIHLEMVFVQLCKHEFYLRKDKCELYTDSIDCLGHRIDDKGLHADANKMAKIREWNTPCNFNDVQRFLGLVQYLAHFLPDVMAYTSSLASITANGTPFSWRPIHEKCFQTIKAMCCRTPILQPIEHRKDEPIWIICDALAYGTGAMYGQGPTWQTCRPAGFMSKKFTDAQWNYHMFEQETLAILEALLKWEDKLLGYRIHVVTDHKALEFFKTQLRLSGRQTRWMEYLARFDFDIRYVKGELNKVADTLSRYYEHDYWTEVPEIQDYVNANIRLDPDHDDLPKERLFKVKEKVIESRVQDTNAKKIQVEIRALRERVQERDTLAEIMSQNRNETSRSREVTTDDEPTVVESRVKGENLRKTMANDKTFEEDILKGYEEDVFFGRITKKNKENPLFRIHNGLVWTQNRGGEEVLCIPSAKSLKTTIRVRIVEQAHQVVGHFGSQRTSDYIRRWYWWPRIHSDVEKYCRSCEMCARSKGECRAPAGKLHLLPIATRPWESIGTDFIGPFPEVDGFNYLWVVICRLSLMVHLIPINTKTTATQLSSIYMREVVRLHGLPSSIISDRDPKFMSKWWRELHRIMGTKLLMSTSFHLQTDGITERANRSIGQIFRAIIDPDQRDWVEKSPLIEFTINSSINSMTGLAPFEINNGYMPVMMKEVKDNE